MWGEHFGLSWPGSYHHRSLQLQFGEHSIWEEAAGSSCSSAHTLTTNWTRHTLAHTCTLPWTRPRDAHLKTDLDSLLWPHPSLNTTTTTTAATTLNCHLRADPQGPTTRSWGAGTALKTREGAIVSQAMGTTRNEDWLETEETEDLWVR